MPIEPLQQWHLRVRNVIAVFTTLLTRHLVMDSQLHGVMITEDKIYDKGADVSTFLSRVRRDPLDIEVKARSSQNSHAIKRKQLLRYLNNLSLDPAPHLAHHVLYFLVGYRNKNVQGGTAMGRILHSKENIYEFLGEKIDFLWIVDPRVIDACYELELISSKVGSDVFYTPHGAPPESIDFFSMLPRTFLNGLVRGELPRSPNRFVDRASLSVNGLSPRTKVLGYLNRQNGVKSWVTAYGSLCTPFSMTVFPHGYNATGDIFGIVDEPFVGNYTIDIPHVGYFGPKRLLTLLLDRFAKRGVNHSISLISNQTS